MSGALTQPRRTWDSVAIGDELEPLSCGPLTPLHLMRFSAAIENWHRIHYDERFATEHDGLPGLLVSGSFKQHVVAQMLRRWAGSGGWLVSVSLQFRRMNQVGETLTIWGTVTELAQRDGRGLVSCEIGVCNEHGVESSPGSARVALPLTADDPPITGWAPS
jgi:acyl dehydratase